jgi:hypothetical protein
MYLEKNKLPKNTKRFDQDTLLNLFRKFRKFEIRDCRLEVAKALVAYQDTRFQTFPGL